jgi:hypothetical protein
MRGTWYVIASQFNVSDFVSQGNIFVVSCYIVLSTDMNAFRILLKLQDGP